MSSTRAVAQRPDAPPTPSTEPTAFGFADELDQFDTGWHAQPRHQIVYAASGVLRLQVGDAQWLLPPQRAAWIRAGTDHRLQASEPVSLRTVYLSTDLVDHPESTVVFEVNPLAREMILTSVRWGPDRDAADQRAERFFLALAAMSGEWVEHAHAFRLPIARSPELGRAMAYALEHLHEEPTIEAAAELAGVSPRTLARRFQDEAGTTWRKFLHDARMMRAMELLADRSRSVSDTAYAVGFNSLGAFTRAFVEFTGERPRDYHKRVIS